MAASFCSVAPPPFPARRMRAVMGTRSNPAHQPAVVDGLKSTPPREIAAISVVIDV